MSNLLYFFIFMVLAAVLFFCLHRLIVGLSYEYDQRYLHCRYLAALVLYTFVFWNAYTLIWPELLVGWTINRPGLQDFWDMILPQRMYKLAFYVLMALGVNLLYLCSVIVLLALVRFFFRKKQDFIDLTEIYGPGRLLHLAWYPANRYYERNEDGDIKITEEGFNCGLWAGGLKTAYLVMFSLLFIAGYLGIIFLPRSKQDLFYLIALSLYILPLAGYLIIEQIQFMLHADIEAEAGSFAAEEVEEIQLGNIDNLAAIYRHSFEKSGALLFDGNMDEDVVGNVGLSSNDLGNQQLADCRYPDILAMLDRQLRESGVRQSDNFQNALVALLNGESINVRDNIRGEFISYLGVYLNFNLSQGNKAVILCEDRDSAANMIRSLKQSMSRINSIFSVWKICGIVEADSDVEMDILVCSTDDFLDFHITDKRRNFLSDLFCVCIMRGMSMFTQDPIRVARLFSDIDKSNRDLQYIMLSDVDNDDLRTACEFYINREMLPFKNDSVSSNTRVMVWKHESAHRLQKWLGLGDDHSRYMGTALPLAVVGIKYDMPRVNIVQGRRNGVYTFRDATAMDLMEVEKYMGSRINLRSTIRFNEYEILEESNICEVVAYDEDCNMMNVLWQWAKYGGTIGTLLHIVSPAYMLRELFTDKYRTYLLGGSLFEAFVPFHQALRTSQMAVMLMELCDNGVTEEYLMSKNEEFGWGCQDILSLLADILENVIRSEEVHSVMESFQFREERAFVPEEGGFVRSTRITLTDEHIRARMLDKISYAVLQERGEQERKIPVLKGNLLNYYLRDQYISVDGYLNYVCDVRNGKIIVEQRMPRDLPDYYTMCDYEISIRALEDACNDTETLDWDLFRGNVRKNIYGYWSSNNGMEFIGTGKGRINNLCDKAGQPISVTFEDTAILRLRIKAEILHGWGLETSRLAVLMMNEIFKTLFPRNYQNICAVMADSPERDFWEKILKDREKDPRDALQSVVPFLKGGKSPDPAYIDLYVLETSCMEFGLVKTLYEKRERLLMIMHDYLEWFLENNPSCAGIRDRDPAPEAEPDPEREDTWDNALMWQEEAAPDQAGTDADFFSDMAGDSPEPEKEKNDDGSNDRKAPDRGGWLCFGMDQVPGEIAPAVLQSVLSVQLPHVKEKDTAEEEPVKIQPEFACTFCGKPSLFITLMADGRRMCNDCKDHQLTQKEEIRTLFRETLRFMEETGHIRIRKNINVRFQSAETIRQAAGGVPYGRVLGFYNNRNKQLWIESRGPRIAIQDTLLHELTHTWQFDNLNMRALNARLSEEDLLEFLEGAAVYTEIYMLEKLNEKDYAAYIRNVSLNRNDEYGRGYRKFSEFARQRSAAGGFATPFKAMKEMEEALIGKKKAKEKK